MDGKNQPGFVRRLFVAYFWCRNGDRLVSDGMPPDKAAHKVPVAQQPAEGRPPPPMPKGIHTPVEVEHLENASAES